MVSYPERWALCLRLEIVKVKIFNFPVRFECSCNGFVFNIQRVMPESYTQIKDVQEVGKILLLLHMAIKLQQVSDGKMSVKDRNIHVEPRRLSLSNRGDTFRSWCAFEVEFLVWLLQLRRLPGSCKILCALGCLRSLTFLERSSGNQLFILLMFIPGKLCHQGQVEELISWGWVHFGDKRANIISYLAIYVIKIPTKVDTFLVVWQPVTRQSTN